MGITQAYAGDIVKFDDTPDGDLMIYGKATGSDLDLDQQRCDPKWLKSAMPEWATWGNIREQHSSIAAGVGLELTEDGDDWYIKALIVDKGTAEKIRKGVLKGLSIGIKNAGVVRSKDAPNGLINRGTIAEISTVDRPCLPTATMAICKAEGARLMPVDEAGVVLHKFDDSEDVPVDDDSDAPVDTEVVEPVVKAEKVKRPPLLLSPRAHKAAVAVAEKILAGDIVKAANDESADIAGAKAVINQIADLIISEATELKTGRMEEIGDLETLMCAVNSMKWFLCSEQMQDGQPGASDAVGDMGGSVTYAGLAADADVTKTVDDAPTEPVSGDVTKGTDAATVVITQPADVQKVLAKVEQQEAEIKNLRADLATLKAKPIPGGPVIMGTTAQQPTAVDIKKSEAARFRATAERTSDLGIRKSYLAMAAELEGDPAKG